MTPEYSISRFWDRPNSPEGGLDGSIGEERRSWTIRQHAEEEALCAALERPDLLDAVRRFLKKHEADLDKVLKTKVVQRMAGLRHIGWKSDKEPGHRYKYARLDHCRHGAALMIVLKLKLGASFTSTLKSVIGFLLHDNGHYAYGHDVELNMELRGYPDHEERGIQNLEYDKELRAVLAELAIEPQDIAAIMREDGDDGLYEMIIDTLAYVILDSFTFGVPIRDDYAWWVILTIEKIEDGIIYVNSIKPLLDKLNRRALLRKYMYSGFSGKILKGALAYVINYAFSVDVLTPDQVMREDDAFLDARLEEMVLGDVPDSIHSAWRLVKGYKEELEHWDVESFGSETSLRAREVELTQMRSDFMVARFVDYGDKEIKVTMDGKQYTLNSDVEFPDIEDNCSWILTWRGKD